MGTLRIHQPDGTVMAEVFMSDLQLANFSADLTGKWITLSNGRLGFKVANESIFENRQVKIYLAAGSFIQPVH